MAQLRLVERGSNVRSVSGSWAASVAGNSTKGRLGSSGAAAALCGTNEQNVLNV